MKTYLETARLRLREVADGDADHLVELHRDPEVMRYLTSDPVEMRARITEDIIPHWRRYYEQGQGFGYWVAEERAGSEFLGWFHFRPGHDEGIELGYRLRRASWGQGFATEASRALIRKGFTELGVTRVFAGTMAVNLGSRRVMEKCGLRLTATMPSRDPKIEGAAEGEVEYALTRADWSNLY